ncbi:MAG TPA: RecQ family ATP-dependent DNA helicase [Micromonosporaceae bacterium]
MAREARSPDSADAATTTVQSAAKQVFGYRLRPSQEAAATALVAGRDTLAVLPTGSGKSAIYQVAGIVLGGLTVVVSPLIALERDQARALGSRTRPGGQPVKVVALNSTLRARDRTAALADLRSGAIDFVMLGPEQLSNEETHAALLATERPVGLFAVDEAHLVSEWGHDFRPDYLRIRDIVKALNRPPLVALTATASQPTQADITRQLAMVDPAVVVADFDRPNIHLSVRRSHQHVPEEQAVVDRTVEVILAAETPAIVYATSHARCEDIAQRLQRVAYRAEAYHAGLPGKRRSEIQDAFFAGRLDVIAATSAFGMGIDKADVRTVVHAGPPGSLDEYYQEIGRAGRDGMPARAELVFDSRSLRIPRLFASRPKLAADVVRPVVAALERLAARPPVTMAALESASRQSRRATDQVIDDMRELGLVEVDGEVVRVRSSGVDGAATDAVVDESRRRASILNSQVDTVRHYAETIQCRRAELLAYFGEQISTPCGNCDNDRQHHRATRTEEHRPPPSHAADNGAEHRRALPMAGTTVQHQLWGHGTVLSADDHELVVAFESVGYRHLTTAVLDTGLVTVG